MTSTVIAASPLIEPPITSAPLPFSTGLLSPVSMASFTDVWPSMTTPSVGIFSPGFTSTRTPRRSSVTDMSRVAPSDATRCASAGMSRTRLSSAAEAPSTDFISIQWPSSMMSISVASSQKKSSPRRPSTTTLL